MNSKNKEYWESYSNLAYNLAGFVSLYVYQDVLICLAFQALGIGSFTYHFDKSPDREHNVIWKFDWWAMAFLNTVLAGSHFNHDMAWLVLIFFHVVYSYFILGKMNVYAEVALSSSVGLTAIVVNRSPTTAAIILTIFAVAIWLRSKDEDPKQLKFHDSGWHSAWHVITAVGYYLAFHLNI